MEGQVVEQMAARRQQLLEMTKKEAGAGRVGYGSDPKLRKDVVPINVLDVDAILGGGFRRGRMAMVVGREAMGKTLFTQWVVKAFQDQGLVCGFMDPEKTFEPAWFTATGVDVEKLIVLQPGSTEQAFDMACMWADNGMDLIVIDSLAALTPQARLEADFVKQDFMGLQARKVTEGMNKWTDVNTDAFLLCTNQLRSKLGVVYGSPDDIPGGRALQHYASYIIRINRKGWIKDGETRIGYHMGVHTLKNKLAPPFQDAAVPFLYTGVIDTILGSVELAVDMGIVTGRRGFYDWRGERYHGKAKLLDFFASNSEDLGILQDMLKGVGVNADESGTADDPDETSPAVD